MPVGTFDHAHISEEARHRRWWSSGDDPNSENQQNHRRLYDVYRFKRDAESDAAAAAATDLKIKEECQKVMMTCPGIDEAACVTNVTNLRTLNLHALIAMSAIAFIALIGSIWLYL